MPLLTMAGVLGAARANGTGVGAFNVISLENAEAVVRGAERCGLPVVLQISQNTVDYHGSLTPVGRACLAVAEEAAVGVVVHLDHATRPGLVDAAVRLGIASVMFDASALGDADNRAATADVARRCHAQGIWVEAELGAVGGKDGVHAPGVHTDPGEARDYVAATAVDALAVAVGSSHAMSTRDASLDDGLIERLAGAVDVPLVLHGSSGVPDDGLVSAVAHGMTKINIATHLNRTMTGRVREVLSAQPGASDPRSYLAPAREAVAAEVHRLLVLLHDGPRAGRGG